MARYYFHVVDGDVSVDTEGTELLNLEAARSAAISAAGEILKEAGLKGWQGVEWQMHIADSNNKTLLKLVFSAQQTGSSSTSVSAG